MAPYEPSDSIRMELFEALYLHARRVLPQVVERGGPVTEHHAQAARPAPLLRQDQALVVFIQGLLVFAGHEIFVTLLFQFLCTAAIFSAFEYCFEAELQL